MSNGALEKLIWLLIYGGLLVLCLSLFLRRADPVLGWALGAVGVVVAFVGAVLVYVRSRRRDGGSPDVP